MKKIEMNSGFGGLRKYLFVPLVLVACMTSHAQTLLFDAFQLGGDRVVGGSLYGSVQQGGGTWETQNGSTVFAAGGGIIADNGTVGFGSAVSNATIISAPQTGLVIFSTSVILGTSEWVGIGFQNNGSSSIFSSPLWLYLRPNGSLNVQGNNNSNPSIDVTGVAGFSASAPISLSINFNLDTLGFNVFVNGTNVTDGFGLAANSGFNLSAVGFYLNGSNGPTTGGAITSIESIRVEAIPEPGTWMLMILGVSVLIFRRCIRQSRNGYIAI